MRHPHLGFRIPQGMVALLDWLIAVAKEEDLSDRHDIWDVTGGVLYDFDTDLILARLGEPVGSESQGELVYDNHPVEVIPFAFNGGDALCYGWALLAEELDQDELPCVSFAPVDDGGPVWLGDTTTEALENMLLGRNAGDRLWDSDELSCEQPEWARVCAALGLSPDLSRTDVTAGARTSRRLDPPVPAGWRYVPTSDGVGVLAPEHRFAPEPFDRRALTDEASTLAAARELLARGFPASALQVLKEGYFEDSPHQIQALSAEVFEALGRPILAARCRRWLAVHP